MCRSFGMSCWTYRSSVRFHPLPTMTGTPQAMEPIGHPRPAGAASCRVEPVESELPALVPGAVEAVCTSRLVPPSLVNRRPGEGSDDRYKSLDDACARLVPSTSASPVVVALSDVSLPRNSSCSQRDDSVCPPSPKVRCTRSQACWLSHLINQSAYGLQVSVLVLASHPDRGTSCWPSSSSAADRPIVTSIDCWPAARIARPHAAEHR